MCCTVGSDRERCHVLLTTPPNKAKSTKKKDMKPNENAVFNRGKPLLERKHVPCEVLMSKDRGSRPTSKRRNTFTLRVLQGHRVSNQGTTSERVIRIELSNEYQFLLLALTDSNPHNTFSSHRF